VFLYALIAGAFLALVLLVHAVAARTVAFLKWPFVLFVLTYLVVQSADPLVDRFTGRDTVQLHVLNESGHTIERLDVFGRGDLVSIDSLPAGSRATRAFRGRLNNYGARDYYTNRVSVAWYSGGRWRERVLVHEDVVIHDSMVIVIPALDSALIGGSPRR
jgi:hypothetical protein